MIKDLTNRELEVLKLSYLSRKEVAKRLRISIQTVNNHRMNIFNKLCAYSLVEAVLIALKSGMVKLEDFEIGEIDK